MGIDCTRRTGDGQGADEYARSDERQHGEAHQASLTGEMDEVLLASLDRSAGQELCEVDCGEHASVVLMDHHLYEVGTGCRGAGHRCGESGKNGRCHQGHECEHPMGWERNGTDTDGYEDPDQGNVDGKQPHRLRIKARRVRGLDADLTLAHGPHAIQTFRVPRERGGAGGNHP